VVSAKHYSRIRGKVQRNRAVTSTDRHLSMSQGQGNAAWGISSPVLDYFNTNKGRRCNVS